MTRRKRKLNLLFSKTFWNILFTIFLAIVPQLQHLERGFTFEDWLLLVATIVSTIQSLMNFHGESQAIYTPDWMPGRNREDVS